MTSEEIVEYTKERVRFWETNRAFLDVGTEEVAGKVFTTFILILQIKLLTISLQLGYSSALEQSAIPRIYVANILLRQRRPRS